MIRIIDELPDSIEFVDANGNWDYNETTNTVIWYLDNLDANSSGSLTLTVKVKDFAIPGGTITNSAKIYSGGYLMKTATENTHICCTNPVVYVNANATEGANNGSSWKNAYLELRDALNAIRNGQHGDCANQIWVAAGTYHPAALNEWPYADKTFTMIDGVDVYGHFEGGWETNIDQRNLADSNFTTILSGDIDDDNDVGDVTYVVTAANSCIDGFTVKKCPLAGVLCGNCSPAIVNCILKDNVEGIRCNYGTHITVTNTFITDNFAGISCQSFNTQMDIYHCTIGGNYYGIFTQNGAVNTMDSIFYENEYGIYAEDIDLIAERCSISDNGYVGIQCYYSTATIKRCIIQGTCEAGNCAVESGDSEMDFISNIISDNTGDGMYIWGHPYDTDERFMNNLIYGNGGAGVYLQNEFVEINNNTIAYNGYGIAIDGLNPPATDPNINNNIIYYNTNGQLSDSYFSAVNYNCIQNYTGGGTGNRTDLPEFVDSDSNDFHLTKDSNCINAGNPNFTTDANEIYPFGTDIDGENRILNNRVDIGADEFNPYDLSGENGEPDGFINSFDFAVIANSWQTHTGQQGYNALCNFYDDGATDYINYKDLFIFCQYWLTPEDWQGIGGDGAYFADTGTGQMQMMMLLQSPSVSAGDLISAESQMIDSEPIDINSLVDWLDDLWQSDKDVQDSIDADAWQEFLESVKSAQ